MADRLLHLQTSTLKRDDYFRFFDDSRIHYPASGNRSKPVLGTLSPGCRSCISGTWSCIFITGDCTRSCFFCPSPQKRSDREKRPNVSENLSFGSVHDYCTYLEKFNFDGISFSGGEPFLVLDTVIDYIREIRKRFGQKHYIWAYTNGDLVTAEKLTRLNLAGLNELRFDIAAGGYSLDSVKTAIDHIGTVSIEIPAIPEDRETVEALLKEMESIGVKHLNLHQLMQTGHNGGHFMKRGYTPVNSDQYGNHTPVMESELAACQILKHAIEINSGLGINYCTRCYKARFQNLAHRKRSALFCPDSTASFNGAGYLRRLSMDAADPVAELLMETIPGPEWEIVKNNEKTDLVFPFHYFGILFQEDCTRVEVLYYEPSLLPVAGDAPPGSKARTQRFAGNTVQFQTVLKYRLELKNMTAASLFYSLFIENSSLSNVIDRTLEAYGLDADNGGELTHDIKTFYQRFADVEYTDPCLQPYT
ncbi:MAG: radical SAM protein [Pseudomonadota bacterium]